MRLIDADALIEKLNSAVDTNSIESIVVVSLLKNLIISQPTVTDTNVGCNWIPVSERLPNEYEDVLVSLTSTEEGGGYTGVAIDCIAYDGKWFAHYNDCITAWMPLPEPYEGNDNSCKKCNNHLEG